MAFAGPGGEEVRTVEREPPARGEAPAPAADAPSSSGGALAGAAVALGAAIFVATKFAMPGPSLAELERDAVPLEEALRNGKPTVMEFYAGEALADAPPPRAGGGEEPRREDANYLSLGSSQTGARYAS